MAAWCQSDLDLTRLCRMSAGEAYDYVDDRMRRASEARTSRVAARVARLRKDIEGRIVRGGGQRGEAAVARLRAKLAEEEARLSELSQDDAWAEFQLAVVAAASEVHRELTGPCPPPEGDPASRGRLMLVIMTASLRQIGPFTLDSALEGRRLAAVVAAVVEDAGETMPERYHFELNGRPFLGSIARTLSVNGSVSGGSVLRDVLSVMEGVEPPRDALQLAPRVMKARLMEMLGLVRDAGFPGADGDSVPSDRDELERERLLGIGICPDCDTPLVWMEDTCDKVCMRCGVATRMLDTAFRSAYTEHSSVTKTNYYERRDHFVTLLKEFQAKEGKEVPEDVLDDVVVALGERRALSPDKIDAELIRNVLRATNHSDYYKNVHAIMATLLGIPPPSLTDQQATSLLSMFMALQDPWHRMTRSEKEGRKNFLNY